MRYVFRVPWEDYGDDHTRYAAGEAVPDKHPKWEWLTRHNIIVDADAQAPAEGPVGEAPNAVETSAEEPSVPRTEVKRPYKAAKLAVWQEYARSQGIDPKGMTREEIIARFI